MSTDEIKADLLRTPRKETMSITVGSQVHLSLVHEGLSPDVRDANWSANCAGEIFVESGPSAGLRIGHFQGDAALAAFVVAAHDAVLSGRRNGQQD